MKNRVTKLGRPFIRIEDGVLCITEYRGDSDSMSGVRFSIDREIVRTFARVLWGWLLTERKDLDRTAGIMKGDQP